tara:strand:+ start:1074 stop:1709 length:636 start_codon:yes stop_codon:yes gene_type:complete
MNYEKRQAIYSIFSLQRPNPKTELIYSSAFELLIAVILSAQTTDVAVNNVTGELFKIANTPEGLIKLGEKKLREKIKRIGLFRNKAKNIIFTCKILVNQHDSIIPENRDLLQKLPGVGRKTANVILNTYFGWELIAVDTHVFRVANRTKLATGNSVDMVEKKLEKNTPKIFKRNAHHWLILHGRYVCKARKPLCENCTINKLCEFKHKVYA